MSKKTEYSFCPFLVEYLANRLRGYLWLAIPLRWPHVWGAFFNCRQQDLNNLLENESFRPQVWGAFFKVCLGIPIPRAPTEQFAAGSSHGVHRAHFSEIKVPIFSVAMGIGENENFYLLISITIHLPRSYLFLVLFVVLSPLRVSITVL